MKNLIVMFCILYFAVLINCSQPILESSDCIEARDSIRKFYSFHIGNDMRSTEENFDLQKKDLSGQLKKKLAEQRGSSRDYFTRTDNFPKAFRAGKCAAVGKNRVSFEILLFWRTDEKSMERVILVEMAKKENSRWLINKVTSSN